MIASAYWYEKQPFKADSGIEAYSRFAVSVLPIEGVGIGVAVDAETAFFTRETVAFFFDRRVSRGEFQKRQELFGRLVQKQAGQKGTLVYDNGIKQLKCYFEQVSEDKTCGNTRPKRIGGKEYNSLVDYYKAINPRLQVSPDAPVFVSFPGLDHPQPVPAECLRIRVMNKALPQSLISADKISPDMRRKTLIGFWKSLGTISFPQIQAIALVERGGSPLVQPSKSLLRSIEELRECAPEKKRAFRPDCTDPARRLKQQNRRGNCAFHVTAE